MGVTSLVYKGIKFDSDEEYFIAVWLDTLQQAGHVIKWRKTKLPIPLTDGIKIDYVKTTKLKTKTKIENKSKELLKPSEYTPDFEAIFGAGPFVSAIYEHAKLDALFYTHEFPKVWLEVKPAFDQNNMERLFKNNQKFVWHLHKIFVNLVEPVELFKKTFLPDELAPYFKYKKLPTGKNKGKKKVGDWKFDWIPKTLKEYLDGHAAIKSDDTDSPGI